MSSGGSSGGGSGGLPLPAMGAGCASFSWQSQHVNVQNIYLNTSKKVYMCKYLYKYICRYTDIYIYIVVNIYIYTYTPQYLSFLFLSLDLQICTTEETDAPDLSPMSSRTGSETLSLSLCLHQFFYIYL